MKWYSGSIAEAVQFSYQNKAIFCVFVLGIDDASNQLESSLEEDEVGRILASDQFVCIRIAAESQEHKQFSEIYTNVLSPSIYCITEKGVPVEIINQFVSSNDLSQRFRDALSRHCKVVGLPSLDDKDKQESSLSSSSTNSSKTNPKPAGSELAAANKAVAEASAAMNEQQLTLDEKIERARKLALAKQQQKMEQEKEDARRLEIERRTAGKGMAELKRWQDEQETKRAMEERKKDKIQEQQLRQRLREQIAQDRAERNARSNMSYVNDSQEPTTSTAGPSTSSPVSQPTYTGKARLQFRMPNGSSITHAFEKEVTLGFVRDFLIENDHVPYREFSIWVAYPRKEFTGSDYTSSLQELNLLPSAALLILPGSGKSTPPTGGSMGANLWTFLAALFGHVVYPLTLIFTYFRGALAAPPPPANPDRPSNRTRGQGNALGGNRRDNPGGGGGPGTSQGSTTSAKSSASGENSNDNRSKNTAKSDNFRGSDGNVHRLRSLDSDSDDEKATWNGNSTQQM